MEKILNKELFQQVEGLTKRDKAGKLGFLGYLVEEVGEVTRCILEEKGLKNKRTTESVLSECADIMNSALGLYIKLGGNYDELVNNMSKKLNRWESRLERKKE